MNDIEHWDTRYAENQTVYGLEPNQFFKSFIDKHKPGTILLPAEGEGRNAVYAASKGWQVDAFDFSTVAKEKALQLAAEKYVTIHYFNSSIEDFKAEKLYDAVGLIFVHLPPVIRKRFHEQVYKSLASGGYLVIEAFAKEQIRNTSGGPKDISMLYDAPILCNDFRLIYILSCGKKELVLNEGSFHQGKAELLQLIGQRL
jgi:hypothetical protein